SKSRNQHRERNGPLLRLLSSRVREKCLTPPTLSERRFYDSYPFVQLSKRHQAGGIVFRGAHKPSRMRRGADTGGSTLWPVGLSDRYEARATFPSKMRQ